MRRVALDDPVVRSPRRALRDTSPCVLPGHYRHGTTTSYAYGCRCDACTDAAAIGERKRLARKRGTLPPIELVGRAHGRISTYVNGKCRCVECRRAAADHRRKFRARRRAADPRRQNEPTTECIFCGEAILLTKGDGALVIHENACQRRRGAA